MNDVRGDVLGSPHGTTPAAVIANKIERFDPLEAVKHSKGDSMDYIAKISDNEPSSVALFKPATKARLLYCNFENLHKTSKSKTYS